MQRVSARSVSPVVRQNSVWPWNQQFVVDVLVGADGNVVCARGVCGHPMLLSGVVEAVRQWRFRPVKENNVPVAYVGKLDFTLCNIGCGKEGPLMTLLK